MKITDNDKSGDFETTVEVDIDSIDPVIEIEISKKYDDDSFKMDYADFCNIRDFIEGFERKIARIRAVK
jgi:hypothetical protein